jgi:hypothetical protein
MKKHITTTWLRTLTAVLLTSLLALLAAGCGGGGDSGTPAATATTLNAVLSAAQEVPATTSTATGTATVTVDAAKTTITVTLNTTGLTGVTASHIHFGAAGANGGVMFSLFAAPATFTSPLTKTLTSADFTAVAANGINTFADAVNAILAGNAYINVHTTANVGGEIRGQIGVTPVATATTLNAALSAAQEVPPTTSTATGTATVTVDAAKTTITVALNTTGLTGVTASHIHSGAVGANGGVMFSLFAAPATFTSPLTKTLTSADFTAVAGITTFADAVAAILAGNTYINVHTTANVGGEIRGQLTP